MSTLEFCIKFCVAWIGGAFLLSLAIGRIIKWLEEDADA